MVLLLGPIPDYQDYHDIINLIKREGSANYSIGKIMDDFKKHPDDRGVSPIMCHNAAGVLYGDLKALMGSLNNYLKNVHNPDKKIMGFVKLLKDAHLIDNKKGSYELNPTLEDSQSQPGWPERGFVLILGPGGEAGFLTQDGPNFNWTDQGQAWQKEWATFWNE